MTAPKSSVMIPGSTRKIRALGAKINCAAPKEIKLPRSIEMPTETAPGGWAGTSHATTLQPIVDPRETCACAPSDPSGALGDACATPDAKSSSDPDSSRPAQAMSDVDSPKTHLTPASSTPCRVSAANPRPTTLTREPPAKTPRVGKA